MPITVKTEVQIQKLHPEQMLALFKGKKAESTLAPVATNEWYSWHQWPLNFTVLSYSVISEWEWEFHKALNRKVESCNCCDALSYLHLAPNYNVSIEAIAVSLHCQFHHCSWKNMPLFFSLWIYFQGWVALKGWFICWERIFDNECLPKAFRIWTECGGVLKEEVFLKEWGKKPPPL